MDPSVFLSLIDDPQVSPAAFHEALGTILQAARDEDSRRRALALLIQGLNAPVSRSALIAMGCGFLIEQGASSTPLEQPLYGFITRLAAAADGFHTQCLATLPADADDEAFAEQSALIAQIDPIGATSWDALENSYLAAIALLSQNASVRRSWKQPALIGQMERLRMHHGGAHWLWKMLQVLDDEPFLVIEPASGKGISGRMFGIAENFQLNVLLMDAFPRGLFASRRVSPQAVAVADGSGPQMEQATITGHWNLCTWRGVSEILRPTAGKPVTIEWIWNEGVPADIPLFEGQRVILLGPASYQRTWNSQRAFGGMRASLVVERTLSATESRTWLERMSAASR